MSTMSTLSARLSLGFSCVGHAYSHLFAPIFYVVVLALEKDLVIHALRVHEGNQTRAARFLGMSRPTLIYRMEKYGLKDGAEGA